MNLPKDEELFCEHKANRKIERLTKNDKREERESWRKRDEGSHRECEREDLKYFRIYNGQFFLSFKSR